MTDIFALARARLATLAALTASNPHAFRATVRGGAVLVHRGTVSPWQATLFLGGEPVGHVEGTWAVAVRGAHGYGADLGNATKEVDHQPDDRCGLLAQGEVNAVKIAELNVTLPQAQDDVGRWMEEHGAHVGLTCMLGRYTATVSMKRLISYSDDGGEHAERWEVSRDGADPATAMTAALNAAMAIRPRGSNR